MKTIEMNVEQLRKRASELEIKNAKKYKKDELIAMINEKEEAMKPKVKVDKKALKKQAFEDFAAKHNGVVTTTETRVTITFSKESYAAAVEEYRSNKKSFHLTFYCFDKCLHQIIFVNKKEKQYSQDVPRGEQSLAIYKLLIEHPNWSHYKIRAIIGCTYTNVRRVWLIYVKDKFVDQREFKGKNK